MKLKKLIRSVLLIPLFSSSLSATPKPTYLNRFKDIINNGGHIVQKTISQQEKERAFLITRVREFINFLPNRPILPDHKEKSLQNSLGLAKQITREKAEQIGGKYLKFYQAWSKEPKRYNFELVALNVYYYLSTEERFRSVGPALLPKFKALIGKIETQVKDLKKSEGKLASVPKIKRTIPKSIKKLPGLSAKVAGEIGRFAEIFERYKQRKDVDSGTKYIVASEFESFAPSYSREFKIALDALSRHSIQSVSAEDAIFDAFVRLHFFHNATATAYLSKVIPHIARICSGNHTLFTAAMQQIQKGLITKVGVPTISESKMQQQMPRISMARRVLDVFSSLLQLPTNINAIFDQKDLQSQFIRREQVYPYRFRLGIDPSLIGEMEQMLNINPSFVPMPYNLANITPYQQIVSLSRGSANVATQGGTTYNLPEAAVHPTITFTGAMPRAARLHLIGEDYKRPLPGAVPGSIITQPGAKRLLNAIQAAFVPTKSIYPSPVTTGGGAMFGFSGGDNMFTTLGGHAIWAMGEIYVFTTGGKKFVVKKGEEVTIKGKNYEVKEYVHEDRYRLKIDNKEIIAAKNETVTIKGKKYKIVDYSESEKKVKLENVANSKETMNYSAMRLGHLILKAKDGSTLKFESVTKITGTSGLSAGVASLINPTGTGQSTLYGMAARGIPIGKVDLHNMGFFVEDVQGLDPGILNRLKWAAQSYMTYYAKQKKNITDFGFVIHGSTVKLADGKEEKRGQGELFVVQKDGTILWIYGGADNRNPFMNALGASLSTKNLDMAFQFFTPFWFKESFQQFQDYGLSPAGKKLKYMDDSAKAALENDATYTSEKQAYEQSKLNYETTLIQLREQLEAETGKPADQQNQSEIERLNREILQTQQSLDQLTRNFDQRMRELTDNLMIAPSAGATPERYADLRTKTLDQLKKELMGGGGIVAFNLPKNWAVALMGTTVNAFTGERLFAEFGAGVAKTWVSEPVTTSFIFIPSGAVGLDERKGYTVATGELTFRQIRDKSSYPKAWDITVFAGGGKAEESDSAHLILGGRARFQSKDGKKLLGWNVAYYRPGLLVRPDVLQQQYNDIVQKLNAIERTYLRVYGKTNLGKDYMIQAIGSLISEKTGQNDPINLFHALLVMKALNSESNLFLRGIALEGRRFSGLSNALAQLNDVFKRFQQNPDMGPAILENWKNSEVAKNLDTIFHEYSLAAHITKKGYIEFKLLGKENPGFDPMYTSWRGMYRFSDEWHIRTSGTIPVSTGKEDFNLGYALLGFGGRLFSGNYLNRFAIDLVGIIETSEKIPFAGWGLSSTLSFYDATLEMERRVRKIEGQLKYENRKKKRNLKIIGQLRKDLVDERHKLSVLKATTNKWYAVANYLEAGWRSKVQDGKTLTLDRSKLTLGLIAEIAGGYEFYLAYDRQKGGSMFFTTTNIPKDSTHTIYAGFSLGKGKKLEFNALIGYRVDSPDVVANMNLAYRSTIGNLPFVLQLGGSLQTRGLVPPLMSPTSYPYLIGDPRFMYTFGITFTLATSKGPRTLTPIPQVVNPLGYGQQRTPR